MSHFLLLDKLLFPSYLPCYLRRRSDFRDQLVVPASLRKIVMNSCHDIPASGGHLAFKGCFDKVRDRFWWPIIHIDVRQDVVNCLSCQHRKTSRCSPKLHAGHRPVTRSLQCVAVDLGKCKTVSEGNIYILSVIDNRTIFVISIAIKNKEATTVVRNLVERVFSVFEPHFNFAFRPKNGVRKPACEKMANCLRVQENAHRCLPPPRPFRPTACAQYGPQYGVHVQHHRV